MTVKLLSLTTLLTKAQSFEENHQLNLKDFSSTGKSYPSVEDQLIDPINNKLTQRYFNASVSNLVMNRNEIPYHL